MRFIYNISALICFICGICVPAFAQNDTIPKVIEMEEIVISVKAGFDQKKQAKSSSSVDEYLQKSEKVQMIKRGGYAWEPAINNMTTERISVTIDGMKIFCACTDRMDPVTSYVETNNLTKVNIGSGFGGDPQASNNIGGSMNLLLNKVGFGHSEWDLNANTGYESNGNAQLYSVDGSYSGDRFYTNAGFSHRQSGNYKAGGGETIRYSQYTKNNVFSNFGFLPKRGHTIEGTLIYDLATNVGYPALTMDVSSAEGIIGSLSYRRDWAYAFLQKWETKIYYNHISHVMDDTKREAVIDGTQMHMDMPGKSQTGGFYSTLTAHSDRHNLVANFDAYHNRSYADMVMYQLPSVAAIHPAPPMWMPTWGDIRTFNSGLALSDEIGINEHNTVRLSAKTSWQRSGMLDTGGFRQFQVYHPDLDPYGDRFLWKETNRLLWNLSGRYFPTNRLPWNVAGKYLYKSSAWELSGGAGYGTRAPSVSEGYGYFLYNTFDGYEYLGNPVLKNEKSLEANASATWHRQALSIKLDGTLFYFTDYIIGKPENLHQMNPLATGVKKYVNLPHATIFNTNLTVKYPFADYFLWRNRLSYAIGRDNEHAPLPLIAPLNGESALSFSGYHFTADASLQASARQTDFSAEYGEDRTPGYLIANLSIGYGWRIRDAVLHLKTGVENVFDKRYSTYSDWNNISRKGRNIFINVGLEIL